MKNINMESIMESFKVLVVEDDETNLEIILKILKDCNHKIVTCVNGEEAWSYLNNNPKKIDIVLLDKMMPKMNGMEVLEKMQNHPILKDTPVIIQTGDVDFKMIKEGYKKGASYYLCKPFDPYLIVQLIEAFCKKTK